MDELARCGVRHAVTSPGSRNAPLALVLAEQRRDRMRVGDRRALGRLRGARHRTRDRRARWPSHAPPERRRRTSTPPWRRPARRPRRCWCSPPTVHPSCATWAPGSRSTSSGSTDAPPSGSSEVGTHEPSRATAVHHRALACRACRDRHGRPARAGAPQLPAARAARPACPRSSRPSDWQGRADGLPWTRVDRRRRRPRRSGAARVAGRRGARGDRVRRGARARGGAGRAAGRRPRLAAAGRPGLGRPLRAARPLARGRPLRRAPARRLVRRGAPSRARAADRASRPCPSRSARGLPVPTRRWWTRGSHGTSQRARRA